MGTKTIEAATARRALADVALREKARRFRRILARWAKKHGRSFPWRDTSDPYRTMIAEIMLQRTRSQQVAPVYQRFIARYPDVSSLAEARLPDVRDILLPLGLAFRARALLALARALVAEYQGAVPLRAEEAVKLPGVGPYVASALDAFLANRRLPVIDANVARVLSRIFDENEMGLRQATAVQRRAIYEFAWECLGRARPRAYHYALLDFAATVCAPRHPACPRCPMHRSRICAYCEARAVR